MNRFISTDAIVKTKIVFLILLFLMMIPFVGGSQAAGQTVPLTGNDTLKTSQQKAQNKEQNGEKNAKQNQAQNQSGQNNAKAAKQINSARPDMSKAKGARPNIVRPSGSSMPKGAGKPAGVGKPGGR